MTSGGGFSTFFPQPNWQSRAVNDYFSNVPDLPIAGFNINGRGIPDVSLIGVAYEVISAGSLIYRYGTSCAAPIFAAFISLVNAYRVSRGFRTVGFINPTLYFNATASAAGVFNDITSGDNRCCTNTNFDYQTSTICCDSGFFTAKG